MQDENQTQNNKESDEIIGKAAENKADLVVEEVESVTEVPKIEQKESESAVLAISAKAETAKEVVEVKSPPPAEQVVETTKTKIEVPTEVASEPILKPKPEPIPEVVVKPMVEQTPIEIAEIVPEPEIQTEPEPAEQAQAEAPEVVEPVEQPPKLTPTPSPSQTNTESHLSLSQSSEAKQFASESLRNDLVGGEPQIKTAETQNKISPQGHTSPVAPPISTPPRRTTFSHDFVQTLLIKARVVIQERKRKKLDKIMTLFETKPQIKSKDIQKLLFAKKRTVTNYLDQLEQEQKIIQVGKKGKGVLYIRKP